MADGKVVISTALNNTGLEKGIKGISGSLGGLTSVCKKASAAIAAAFSIKAIASFVKSTADAYANFEQLSGGIETLFKNSASRITDYAEDAFYTAGVSANEYMEIVTSFSASLISSLGGDTAKAADVANMALIDMSDNANKMGTSLENIQSAYQGFAKQNYTLLDNLKLGYGGTKTEMERLLKDAQALTGVEYDISNLGDVYSAIHAIQKKLGIAGATAEEAEKTITGSANMTKAAWQNVLSAISGGGDIDKAINNLTYSISKYFDNIVPVVQRAISGIGTLIKEIAPQLVQAVTMELIKAIPDLLGAVYQMIIGLAQGIYRGIIALFKGGTTAAISAQFNDVSDSADAAADAAGNLAEETEKAGKAAKKALAGFDELNILSAGTDTGAESSSASGSVSVSTSVNIDTSEMEDATTGLTSVVTSIFEELQEKIAEYANLFEPTFSAWKTAFGEIESAIRQPVQTIGEAFSNLWDNTLAPLGSYIISDWVPSIANTFSENLAPIFSDVMSAAVVGFANDFENMTLVVDEACSWLEVGFENVGKSFSDMCSSIKEKWDEYGGSILSGFLEFKEGLWEIFWSIYDGVIKPVLENAAEMFTQLWDNHLKPLWDNIVEFAMSLWDNILQLWNDLIKPVVDYVVAVLAPIVTNAINAVVDAVSIAIGYISDNIGAVLKILDGVITFLVGVFTLDFEKAWDGIKKIFTGAWNALVAGLETAINAIIWGINQLVAKIYSGIASVVNGLGSIVETVGNILGQDWGFGIPTAAPALSYVSIPRLAQGAVIPANHEFLAVLGDQKHGTNIEAPLSTIQEAVAAVMADYEAANLAGHEATVEVLREILQAVLGIRIGDEVIAAAVSRYNSKIAVAKGG